MDGFPQCILGYQIVLPLNQERAFLWLAPTQPTGRATETGNGFVVLLTTVSECVAKPLHKHAMGVNVNRREHHCENGVEKGQRIYARVPCWVGQSRSDGNMQTHDR